MPQRFVIGQVELSDQIVAVDETTDFRNFWAIKTAREIRPNLKYPLEDPDALIVVYIDKFGFTNQDKKFAVLGDMNEARQLATDLFRRTLASTWYDIDGALNLAFYLQDLIGKDVACTCDLEDPCHGDVLLDFANRPEVVKTFKKDQITEKAL